MSAISPARAANVATYVALVCALSFTPKSRAKFLAFMSAVYAWSAT